MVKMGVGDVGKMGSERLAHTHTRRSVRDRSAPHRIGERWASPWARQMGGAGRERGGGREREVHGGGDCGIAHMTRAIL